MDRNPLVRSHTLNHFLENSSLLHPAMLTVILYTASLLTVCCLPCCYNLSFPSTCSVTPVMSESFHPHGPEPFRLLCPWDSPGKITRVHCHALFQGIFLTQGSNPSLTSSARAGRFSTTGTTWEAQVCICKYVIFTLFKLSLTSHVPSWSPLTDLIALCSKSVPFLDHHKIDTSKSPALFNMHEISVGGKNIQLFPPAHIGLGRIFTTGTYKYFTCRLLCGNIIL